MATNRRLVDFDGADFYPTPEWGTSALLENERFDGIILEPCCGDGSMSEVLNKHNTVWSSDLFDRNYGLVKDAFSYYGPIDNVVTNPPFAIAEDLFHHFYPIVQRKLCLLLRTAFLEGAGRYNTIFKDMPPETVYVFSERLSMYPAGQQRASGGTTSYSWFVWDKTLLHSHKDSIPKIKWIMPGLKPNSRNKR